MTDIFYQKKEGLITRKWTQPQRVKKITFQEEDSNTTTVLEMEDGSTVKICEGI